jgi:hypothetical protein
MINVLLNDCEQQSKPEGQGAGFAPARAGTWRHAWPFVPRIERAAAEREIVAATGKINGI